MRLILSGACGRMGREVAACAEAQPDCEVVCGVDAAAAELPFPLFGSFRDCPKADCIIDFSAPEALSELLGYAVETKTPAVLATTGHTPAQRGQIEAAARQIPILASGNLSRGARSLRDLAADAAQTLAGFDLQIVEEHHAAKRDAPSGTALLLAEAIARRTGASPPITSLRAGGIRGIHTVRFVSQDEMLELRHTAFSRRCFAAGAIEAARFLLTQERGLFSEIP